MEVDAAASTSQGCEIGSVWDALSSETSEPTVVFRESDPKLPTKRSRIDDAFDCHFHLDRMFKVKSSEKSDKLKLTSMWYRSTRRPVHTVVLKGGVACFCDPETYPSHGGINHIVDLSLFGIAIGHHPKHQQLSDQTLNRIRLLMTHPKVVAFGEIGLDYTAQVPIAIQEDNLRRLLQISSRTKPVVFHVRARSAKASDISDAYDRVLEMAKAYLAPSQVIQLHSFNGGKAQVTSWLQAFPDTYFSLSGLVDSFRDYQQAGVRQIPSTHLLLETDSPYLSVANCDEDPKRIDNHPTYLGSVAKLVARMRQSSMYEILESGYANAIAVFVRPPVRR